MLAALSTGPQCPLAPGRSRPTFCRPRCGQIVRLVLVCVILPLTRTSKCRSDWWRSKCPAPAEGGSRLQNANLVPGTTWRTFFLRRFQKLEVHFAPLNRHSNVECKMRLTASGFERQSDAQSCVLLLSPPPITPSFTTNEQAAMLY